MKKLTILFALALIGLTVQAQQRIIVDSITTRDSIARIYFKIEKRIVDTTAQLSAMAPGLQQEIAVRELSLKFLEKSIRAQIPFLDSIKNDQAKQYAIEQIMKQDREYVIIRADVEILKSVFKELNKVKK